MRLFIYMAAGFILTTNLHAEETPLVWDEASILDDWSRAVREFRRDHNVGILVGQTQTHWQGATAQVGSINTNTTGGEVTLQYSFHIPWTHGFGYSLGTSTSVIVGDHSDTIEMHYRATLPGLELGLVWNINDHWRTNLGGGYGWERVDGLKVVGQEGRLSLSEETMSAKFSIDYFYKLTWAVRFEVALSRFPHNASASYDLENSIYRTRIGLIKHLL
ncbi:MAG: hypothetical protein H7249_11615 [Chitinophagaceae bacterium]|nr:hypothetical protein [Oligoflexus sp.]